jgi:hypothetical protein
MGDLTERLRAWKSETPTIGRPRRLMHEAADRIDELEAALGSVQETCRHDVGVERCGQPAIVIVWGKLVAPDEFGPRCADHVPHWWDSGRPDQYAVLDLRPVNRALGDKP